MGSSSALNRGFDDTLTKAQEKGIPVVAIDTGIEHAWLGTMSRWGQNAKWLRSDRTSASPSIVLQNSLLHCERAIIKSGSSVF
jgi:hypothetical protein